LPFFDLAGGFGDFMPGDIGVLAGFVSEALVVASQAAQLLGQSLSLFADLIFLLSEFGGRRRGLDLTRGLILRRLAGGFRLAGTLSLTFALGLGLGLSLSLGLAFALALTFTLALALAFTLTLSFAFALALGGLVRRGLSRGKLLLFLLIFVLIQPFCLGRLVTWFGFGRLPGSFSFGLSFTLAARCAQDSVHFSLGLCQFFGLLQRLLERLGFRLLFFLLFDGFEDDR